MSRTFGTLAVPFSSDTIQSFPAWRSGPGGGSSCWRQRRLFTYVVDRRARRRRTRLVVVRAGGCADDRFLFIGPYLEGSSTCILQPGWGLVLGGRLGDMDRHYLRLWAAIVFSLHHVDGCRRGAANGECPTGNSRQAARDILRHAARLADSGGADRCPAGGLPATVQRRPTFTNGFSEAIERPSCAACPRAASVLERQEFRDN